MANIASMLGRLYPGRPDFDGLTGREWNGRNEGLRRRREEFEGIMAGQQQPTPGTVAAGSQSPHNAPHSAEAGFRKFFKIRQ